MPTGVSRVGARSLSAEHPADLRGGSGGSEALPTATATALLAAPRAAAAAPVPIAGSAPTLTVTPPAPEATAPTISIRTRARRADHRINPLAIVALVLGCLLSPLAALFGHLALARITTAGQRGRLPAILGIVLGYLSLAVAAGIGIVDLVIHA